MKYKIQPGRLSRNMVVEHMVRTQWWNAYKGCNELPIWQLRCICGKPVFISATSLSTVTPPRSCGCHTFPPPDGTLDAQVYTAWSVATADDQPMATFWQIDYIKFYFDLGPPPSAEHVLHQLDPADGWYPHNTIWKDTLMTALPPIEPGMTIHNLETLKIVGKATVGGNVWELVCLCGRHFYEREIILKNRPPLSCGCTDESSRGITIGWGGTAIDRVHRSMVRTAQRWGLPIEEHWRADVNAFCSRFGERPSDQHKFTRTDPLLGFVEGNCGWSLPTIKLDT